MPRIPSALAVLAVLAICVGFNAVRYPAVREMAAVATGSTPPAEAADCHGPGVAVPATVARSAVKPAGAAPAQQAKTAKMAQTAAKTPSLAAPMVCTADGVCRLPGPPGESAAAARPSSVARLAGGERGAAVAEGGRRAPEAGHVQAAAQPPATALVEAQPSGRYAAPATLAAGREQTAVGKTMESSGGTGPSALAPLVTASPAAASNPPSFAVGAAAQAAAMPSTAVSADSLRAKPLVPVVRAAGADCAGAPSFAARSAPSSAGGAASGFLTATQAIAKTKKVERLPPVSQALTLVSDAARPDMPTGTIPMYPSTPFK